jgi:hypothetical protein
VNGHFDLRLRGRLGRGRAPSLYPSGTIGQTNRLVAALFGEAGDAMSRALFTITLLFIALLIGRRREIACVIAAAVLAVVLITSENWLITGPRSIINAVLVVFISGRYGLLALTVFIYTTSLLTRFPLVLDPSFWYAGRSYLIVAICWERRSGRFERRSVVSRRSAPVGSMNRYGRSVTSTPRLGSPRSSIRKGTEHGWSCPCPPLYFRVFRVFRG